MKVKKPYINLLLLFPIFCWTRMANAQQSLNLEQLESHQEVYRDAMFASGNGQWFAYGQRSKTSGSRRYVNAVTVRSTVGGKDILLPGLDISTAMGFTGGGNFFVYPDTSVARRFHVLELSSGNVSSIDDIDKPVIPQGNTSDEILCRNKAGDLFIFVARTQSRKLLARSTTYFQSQQDGHTLLVTSKNSDGSDHWKLLDSKNGKSSLVTTGGNYENPVWSEDGKQLAFLEHQEGGTAVWLYDRSAGSKRMLLSDREIRKTEAREVVGLGDFRAGGQSLEVSLKELPKAQPVLNPPVAKVTIWSYSDAQMHTKKPQKPMPGSRSRQALILMESGKLVDLESHTKVFRGAVGNWYYGLDSTNHFFLISANDSKQITLTRVPADPAIFLNASSDDGNYLLYYYQNHWYGYDIGAQKATCLTSATGTDWYEPTPLLTEKGHYHMADGFPVPVGGSLFRVGDQYDRWILDASGKKAPVCLTEGYGRRNRITLKEILRNNKRMILDGKLLLTALGDLDRKRGFFVCSPTVPAEPQTLVYMEAKFDEPQVTADGNHFFVVRETSQEAPNWYSSADCSKWVPISDVQPGYEGFKTQVLVGKVVNGHEARATLYMPMNLDHSKKYPVILNYYEQMTANCHDFLYPALTAHNINIPWFLERGYLVLTPDIYYRQGHAGESALSCINAAVDALLKLPYVDSTKMGIQGHSFGGFETFYVAAHSTRFKAAMAAAGLTDMISLHNTLPETVDNQRAVSSWGGQFRIATTLWERPDFYLANSPVLEADKVQTPLLIMHNKGDNASPYVQAMEFFMSMHRLGRPCWMLEYEGERHTIEKIENKIDYTMRMTQFFDHYLKGAPAPLWMIDGMKYRDPKYTPGYELDTLGRKPGPGINSPEEQKKIDEYSKIPLSDKLKPLLNKTNQ